MSTVTDPIFLDRTGQDIATRLQKIADAINGGTIDPLTATANGVYTPSAPTLGYGPVTVNVPTGLSILTRTQWNALTTEEKQGYGQLVIQDRDSGFYLGEYVNGAYFEPFNEAEMVPIDSWNASTNVMYTVYFPSITLAGLPTIYCLAIMSQNGTNPAWSTSDNLVPPMATGNEGNGNWAICYGPMDLDNDNFARTVSTGNNWNNSEIVCFAFSGDVSPALINYFYEQGKDGRLEYSYTPEKKERLLLVVMRGGSTGGNATITGLTLQSHVTASGARFNDVYYGELTSDGQLSLSVPYSAGNVGNGSLLVALFRLS